MRISIIGQPGSGKSTLARKISKKLNIPHLHIDKFWFETGGNPKNEEEKEQVRAYIKEKVKDFLQKENSWVSDGWYWRVQPTIAESADQIIFLDVSLLRRLFNHLKRLFFRDSRHAEVSFFNDLKFFYEIIRRTFIHGPRIRKFVKTNTPKVKKFRTYKEVNWYLDSLT